MSPGRCDTPEGASVDWLSAPTQLLDRHSQSQARQRQDRLIKPRGALGALEGLALRLAGLQGDPTPRIDHVRCCLFAADHGVAAEGVSAYPQSVTNQMLRGIATGGAAISVLAHTLGAELAVFDRGTIADPSPIPGVYARRLGPGTGDIAREPAMTRAQLTAALAIGQEAAEGARDQGVKLLICGEMGIANTTAAAALGCALLDLPAAALAGPGTGLDPSGVARKVRVIDRTLERHRAAAGPCAADPLAALQGLGGFEIAAIAGCYVRAAQLGVPVLVDGFIATAAALTAHRIQPSVAHWLIYAHRSAEPGHKRLLDALDARPLLDLGLRLGEGSGAALALPLLRLACALHSGMATFDQAGVSEA